jgi:predicted phosphodiesterase
MNVPLPTWLLGLALLATLPGCVVPECTTPNYALAECRVIAENEVARLQTAAGAEVRFQDPEAGTTNTWDALGLLQELSPGVVRGRVASPGQFAISIDPPGVDANPLQIVLDNVDAAASLRLSNEDSTVLLMSDEPGLERRFAVSFAGAGPVWIRGERDCPPTYRIAVTADIQTNERNLERLHEEAKAAEDAGEPLVGLLVLGDLTESSRDDEFDRVLRMLETSPVPVAVTAGNHDIYRPLRPHYNYALGPGNYAFTVCDTRVAMLDSGSGSIARSIEARLPELFDRRGARFLLVGVHHPPFAGLTGSGWSQEDRAHHMLARAAMAGADLILSGHNHSLEDFPDIDVGDAELRGIVVGTGGAFQGLGTPRYGYLRLRIGEQLETCYVEVPPPGYAGPANEELSDRLPYCSDD